MKKQNIEDANLLRDYAQKISMHPNCAPTETIAEWYAILFNKFASSARSIATSVISIRLCYVKVGS